MVGDQCDSVNLATMAHFGDSVLSPRTSHNLCNLLAAVNTMLTPYLLPMFLKKVCETWNGCMEYPQPSSSYSRYFLQPFTNWQKLTSETLASGTRG